MAPRRVTGSGFALMRYSIVPSPCPSFPDVIWIHATDAEDAHVHSRAAETVTLPVPPDGEKLDELFAMVNWQREAVGPVTLVVAELPHACAVTAARSENSRARTRVVTAQRNSTNAPATMEGDAACVCRAVRDRAPAAR
jgi:hypothetical protein